MNQRPMKKALANAAAVCVAVGVLYWQSPPSAAEAQTTKVDRADIAPWYPLKVALVDTAGRGVEGWVSYSGKPLHYDRELGDRTETGRDGVADLGTLPAGQYKIEVQLKKPSESTGLNVLLGPGRPSAYKVTCPTEPPARAAAKFQIEPPSDLAKLPLYYVAHVEYLYRQFAGRHWQTRRLTANEADWKVRYLLDSSGRILGEIAREAVVEWEQLDNGVARFDASRIPSDVVLREARDLLGYHAGVEFATYIAEGSQVTSSDVRPPLRIAFRGSRLHQSLERADDGTMTCRIDKSSPLWRTLREKTKEYKLASQAR